MCNVSYSATRSFPSANRSVGKIHHRRIAFSAASPPSLYNRLSPLPASFPHPVTNSPFFSEGVCVLPEYFPPFLIWPLFGRVVVVTPPRPLLLAAKEFHPFLVAPLWQPPPSFCVRQIKPSLCVSVCGQFPQLVRYFSSRSFLVPSFKAQGLLMTNSHEGQTIDSLSSLLRFSRIPPPVSSSCLQRILASIEEMHSRLAFLRHSQEAPLTGTTFKAFVLVKPFPLHEDFSKVTAHSLFS